MVHLIQFQWRKSFDLTADLSAGDPLIKSTIGPLTVDFTGLTQYNQKPILTL